MRGATSGNGSAVIRGGFAQRASPTTKWSAFPGYYHPVDGNFQISMDHPPLSKMWAALPLCLSNQTSGVEVRPWRILKVALCAPRASFWSANSTHFRLFRSGHGPDDALTLALGLLIFIMLDNCSGRARGVRSRVFSVEPTVLAQGTHCSKRCDCGSRLPLVLLYTARLMKAGPDSASPNLSWDWRRPGDGYQIFAHRVAPILSASPSYRYGKLRVETNRARARGWMDGVAALAALLVNQRRVLFQSLPPEEISFVGWPIFSTEYLSSVMKAVKGLSCFAVISSHRVDAVLARNRYGNQRRC